MQRRNKAKAAGYAISLMICLAICCCLSQSIFASSSQSTLQQLFQKDVLKTYELLQTDITKRLQNSEVRIVIDAGHGGKDPGALGLRNGVLEKNIVLIIAKKLAKELKALPNRKVIMTRHGDYYLPLRKRLQIARRARADIFIAIHADAHFEAKAKGAAVYILSQHGASSEAAKWLADRENAFELGEAVLISQDRMVKSVMLDLAQTATIKASKQLGRRVLAKLDDVSRLHHTDVERAPFVVLKSPDIPSILIETGFITNDAEEMRLMNPYYQDQLAHAICMGIEDYLSDLALNDIYAQSGSFDFAFFPQNPLTT